MRISHTRIWSKYEIKALEETFEDKADTIPLDLDF